MMILILIGFPGFPISKGLKPPILSSSIQECEKYNGQDPGEGGAPKDIVDIPAVDNSVVKDPREFSSLLKDILDHMIIYNFMSVIKQKRQRYGKFYFHIY